MVYFGKLSFLTKPFIRRLHSYHVVGESRRGGASSSNARLHHIETDLVIITSYIMVLTLTSRSSILTCLLSYYCMLSPGAIPL